jgi:hypothetical protein
VLQCWRLVLRLLCCRLRTRPWKWEGIGEGEMGGSLSFALFFCVHILSGLSSLLGFEMGGCEKMKCD